jgi:hypothetical protein
MRTSSALLMDKHSDTGTMLVTQVHFCDKGNAHDVLDEKKAAKLRHSEREVFGAGLVRSVCG